MNTVALGDDERESLVSFSRIALARRSLVYYSERMDPTYQRAPHLDLLCQYLEALERGEIDKLAVCFPPRHGKSRTVAQDFVAWWLGRQPKAQIILASYGAELAEGHSRKAREQLRDPRYPFPVRVDDSTSAVGLWQTDKGGIVRSAGVGGALTGFGADLLAIDDAFKDLQEADSERVRENVWNWYSGVARTRLMPRGRQVLIGTRWNEDDLLGRAMQMDGWTKLILPALAEDGDPLGRPVGEALWPAWYPADKLPSVETGEISSRIFAALYQQHPIPAEGALFKSAWLQHRYREVPEWVEPPRAANFTPGFSKEPVRKAVTKVTFIDTAAKTGVSNDFSAIVTLVGDRRFAYVTDVVRKRMEFNELARAVVDSFERNQPSRVAIEDTSSGIPLIQELRRLTNIPVIAVPAKGSKLSRAEAKTGLFEAGRVLLPESAPWLGAFIDEFLSFREGCKHDDQVDATVGALDLLERVIASEMEAERLRGQVAGGFMFR